MRHRTSSAQSTRPRRRASLSRTPTRSSSWTTAVRDATRELAQARAAADPRVRVLVHDGNRGYGAAVRTGIAAARLEWVFLTDADLQFDVTELARFVPLAQSSDIVAGFRTHRADPPHRLLNAAAWNVLVRRLFDVPAARRRLCLQAHASRPRAGAAPRRRGRDGEHRARHPRPRSGRAHRRARRRPSPPGGRAVVGREPAGRAAGLPASCAPCARSCARARRPARPPTCRRSVPAGAPADLSRPRAA